MENTSVYNLITEFNHSDFRRKSIPQEVAAGWPCVQYAGKMLAITIPFFARKAGKDKIALYPIYCSVTFPILNPKRLLDFTIYPLNPLWSSVDYNKPAGYFKQEAIKDIKKQEYKEMCMELYGYYDKMVEAVLAKKPFEESDEMSKLFTKLMEPGLYPFYKKINGKFYTSFCRL